MWFSQFGGRVIILVFGGSSVMNTIVIIMYRTTVGQVAAEMISVESHSGVVVFSTPSSDFMVSTLAFSFVGDNGLFVETQRTSSSPNVFGVFW